MTLKKGHVVKLLTTKLKNYNLIQDYIINILLWRCYYNMSGMLYKSVTKLTSVEQPWNKHVAPILYHKNNFYYYVFFHAACFKLSVW